jgi:hypothetical protein
MGVLGPCFGPIGRVYRIKRITHDTTRIIHKLGLHYVRAKKNCLLEEIRHIDSLIHSHLLLLRQDGEVAEVIHECKRLPPK